MRKIQVFVMLLFCTTASFAQVAETTAEEETARKEAINEIKLSQDAVYADVIETLTDDNEAISLAQQKSINLLQAHVIEIFAKRMHMEKQDVQEIWDVIDDKCQNIVIRKGDLFRVFSYIMKDAVGLNRSKPKKGDVEKYLADDAPAVAADDAPEEVTQLVNVLTSGKDSVDNVAQPAPSPRPVPAASVPAERKSIQVPDFIRPVMEKKTFSELMQYLKGERNRTLVFGGKKDMADTGACYVAVFDRQSQSVVCVLGKGTKERPNYTSLKMDDLSNYQGGTYAAIFIQEYTH